MIETSATAAGLYLLLLAALAWFLVRGDRPRNTWSKDWMPETPPPPKQKPLPPELQPPELQPKVEPTETVADTDPLRPHLFELIAAAVNANAKVKWWDLRGLTAGTTAIGNWRITVERIED